MKKRIYRGGSPEKCMECKSAFRVGEKITLIPVQGQDFEDIAAYHCKCLNALLTDETPIPEGEIN